jgi:hypothetical protein
VAKIAHIIRQAAQQTGVYTAEGDAVPGDIYAPMFEMLVDIVRELNTQNAISFGKGMIDLAVSGRKITFKPYTTAEQAIIDGGGSVDITDRVVTITPDIAPAIYLQNNPLLMLSYVEIIKYKSDSSPEFYAFNRLIDSAEILLNAPGGGENFTIAYNIPITIDSEPFGDVQIPPTFDRFLIAKLVEAAAGHYQFQETQAIARMRVSDLGAGLATNNTANAPISADRWGALNRYRTRNPGRF